MPLWGSVDNAANSDIAVLPQLNRPTSSAERTELYGNTTADAYFAGKTVGQFGVDTNEAQASKNIPHAGWNLRTEGSGGRSGRIHYECLVAMGSITGDGTDDTTIPDYTLSVTTNPTSNTARWGVPVRLTGAVGSRPSGASITYVWQRNTGSGWGDLSDAGVYANTGTTHLDISNNALLDTVIYRLKGSATGAVAVYSANATLTVTPYTLGFATQPAANTMGAGNAVVFFVAANSVPVGASITYQWQKNYGTGWSTVTNGGVFSGATSNTLTISDNTDLTDNVFRVQINAPGATSTANSANALLTVA